MTRCVEIPVAFSLYPFPVLIRLARAVSCFSTRVRHGRNREAPALRNVDGSMPLDDWNQGGPKALRGHSRAAPVALAPRSTSATAGRLRPAERDGPIAEHGRLSNCRRGHAVEQRPWSVDKIDGYSDPTFAPDECRTQSSDANNMNCVGIFGDEQFVAHRRKNQRYC